MATGQAATNTPQDELSTPGALWGALAVRPSEVHTIRRLFSAAALVGFALVFFFSGSNALFLDKVGADALPWVYITNAPLVIVAGFAYAAWSRRSPTEKVLSRSIWLLTLTVTVLWLWAWITDGPSAAFAAAVFFRFLFIFGLLGLWEISSAVFDVRQSKRLFPAIALGTMVAFVVGGALVTVLTTFLAAVHLIALSAASFAFYGFAFARAMEGADFAAADEAAPATPREIVSDRFSRNLAAMRYVVILLIFVTEFIFYEQVGQTFGSEDAIARFLGIFMAASTLAMVIFTATASGRYISRFGVGIGLATMPGGVALCALALGLYGTFVGIDSGFFALAVLTNLLNIVMSNGVETPVGAVMYQPMPVERRMAVRIAVDGWLGSVALLAAGLLLLAFDALNFSSVLPFVWLLFVVGVVGVFVARRLYADYLQSLAVATTLAFSGDRQSALLADFGEGSAGVSAGLLGDDPAATFALASLARHLEEEPLTLVLPELADSADPEVATLALDAMAATGDSSHVPRLEVIASDANRPAPVRSCALRTLHAIAPARAEQFAHAAHRSLNGQQNEFTAAVIAVCLSTSTAATTTTATSSAATSTAAAAAEEITTLANSPTPQDRIFAAQALSDVNPGIDLTDPLGRVVIDLIGDDDHAVQAAAMHAARGRIEDRTARALLQSGQRPSLRRAAVDALATGDAATVEVLDSLISDLPNSYIVDLVDRVYAPNTRRPPVLHRFLDPTAPSHIRRSGFDAMRIADVSLPASLGRLLRDDADFTRLLLATWRDCIQSDRSSAPAALALVLTDEFDAARAALWAGLRLHGQPSRISEIEQLTRQVDEDARANGIEFLDTVLPRDIAKLTLPFLEPLNIDEAASLCSDLTPPAPPTDALLALFENPRIAPSTRRVVQEFLPAEHRASTDQETTAMSETIERVLALKQVDIFSTLPFEILAELAEVATEQTAPSGEVIISEGEFGDELFALTAGAVQVTSGNMNRTLTAGTVFGELAVLAPGPRSATVTAQEECQMLVVGRAMLLALTARRPEVMAEIARVLAGRLRDSST